MESLESIAQNFRRRDRLQAGVDITGSTVIV